MVQTSSNRASYFNPEELSKGETKEPKYQETIRMAKVCLYWQPGLQGQGWHSLSTNRSRSFRENCSECAHSASPIGSESKARLNLTYCLHNQYRILERDCRGRAERTD